MKRIQPPYYPIIYVRGYAMTQAEIEATVSTPYMGFNFGSTKQRQDWTGAVRKHIFESPLIRLMKDWQYRDIYHDGVAWTQPLPSRCVVIHRYYDQADSDLGIGKLPSIEDAARGLRALILKLRDALCASTADRAAFRVYLVAHSMGGLVVRCFLQNDSISKSADRALVDKVFTYATPHNGIDMAGVNVPEFLSLWDINNFNREKMADYLQLPADAKRVDSLDGKFDPERCFCLVGTDDRDYTAAAGVSKILAGKMSDGLVRIDNAAIQGAPRAFVYRCHSGPFGIVNSESGYQNLARFLFGDLRVDGSLEAINLPLPPSIEKAHRQGKKIRASYYFEASVSTRGGENWRLSERRKDSWSAVLRKFDELFPAEKSTRRTPRSPKLFSVFLDSRLKPKGDRWVTFVVDLAVSATGYEVDGILWFDKEIPGENLLRENIVIRVRRVANEWDVRYTLADNQSGEVLGSEANTDRDGLFVPLTSTKGFRSALRLQVKPWNAGE